MPSSLGVTDGAGVVRAGRTVPIRRLPAVALAATATWGAAMAIGLLPLVHAAQWLVAGLIGIPVLFALALGVVVSLLSGIAAILAVPTWLRRCPTGLGALLSSLWALPAGILPGYWRALRRVRPVWLWDVLAGFLLGVILFASVGGHRPGM